MLSKADMSVRHCCKSLPIVLTGLALVCFITLCIVLQVSPDRLIGAAFCHQVAARSPEYGFPFCYRCSGLFFGLFWGMFYTFINSGNKKGLKWSAAIPVVISFALFLTDIINTTEYIPVRLYPERISIRFLSSYPMGFFFAGTVAAILPNLFDLKKTSRSGNLFVDLAILFLSGLISYQVVFSGNRLIMKISGFLVSFGSLLFLAILYSILIKCITLLRNRAITFSTCLKAAFFPALCQICILGGLHLYLFPFDQFFS